MPFFLCVILKRNWVLNVNDFIFTVYLGLHFRLMSLNCLFTLHGSDIQTNDIIALLHYAYLSVIHK